jgi:hypothetical protein
LGIFIVLFYPFEYLLLPDSHSPENTPYLRMIYITFLTDDNHEWSSSKTMHRPAPVRAAWHKDDAP